MAVSSQLNLQDDLDVCHRLADIAHTVVINEKNTLASLKLKLVTIEGNLSVLPYFC